jgi:undecaprenyl-diphosphatase
VRSVISFRDAFIIGLAQACAVIPGLSRSGSTIATGILLGNNKENVAKFSFLMVLVPILGEAFLDLMKGNFGQAESGISTLSLAVGFLAAFISGFIACSWMLNLVKKGKLIWFAVYCFIVGVTVLSVDLF